MDNNMAALEVLLAYHADPTKRNKRGVSLLNMLMKRGQKPGTRAEPSSGMPGGRGGFGSGDYGYGRGRDDRGRSSEFISYPNQYGSNERYAGDSKPPLPPTPGADPAYAAWYAQYGHLSAQSQAQAQYQSKLVRQTIFWILTGSNSNHKPLIQPNSSQ